MAEPSPPPPPPPPLAEDPGFQVGEAFRIWEQELDRAITQMTQAVEAAVADHAAGKIDLPTLQKRCLEAGGTRVGDMLLLWDWVNGKVFSYDGFEVVELTRLPR